MDSATQEIFRTNLIHLLLRQRAQGQFQGHGTQRLSLLVFLDQILVVSVGQIQRKVLRPSKKHHKYSKHFFQQHFFILLF